MSTGWECIRRFLNKLITWAQEEGWNVALLIFFMWSLFCNYGIFWGPTFSVTAPVRHWGAPELKTWVYKTLLCLGDTWTVSPLSSAPRASINPKPAPVAHLEFLTFPPKLSLLNLKGQSWSQHRKESTGASSLLGALSPEVFALLLHTSTFKGKVQGPSPQVPHGRARLWAGDEPCCHRSGFPQTSWCCVWGDSLGFFLDDFLVLCVRRVWCLWWQKCHLRCQ